MAVSAWHKLDVEDLRKEKHQENTPLKSISEPIFTNRKRDVLLHWSERLNNRLKQLNEKKKLSKSERNELYVLAQYVSNLSLELVEILTKR